MSPIAQILVATIILCILLICDRYQNQKNRKSWIYLSNTLRDLVSEIGIIKWETPVFYSPEKCFKSRSIWKDTVFEGCGLLCQIETGVVFAGVIYNDSCLEDTLNTFAPDCISVFHYDPECIFIRYTFSPDRTDVAWIGRFWVNVGRPWFALSTQTHRHYFSVHHGKRTIFGLKAENKKIYK
jgi:hypothetical protein